MSFKVILFPHTHWDREWYKPFQDFRVRLAEVMELVIAELKNGNLEYFYLDGQTVLLEDYLELYPEKADEVKGLIRDKKLFTGPWYVLADEFLVSGESLVRNLLIGLKQARKLGCEDFFGYLPDSFGHNSCMPQILSSFGIKNTVLWRGAGDKKSEFIWKSDDGSSVLVTYLTEGYFQDVLHSKANKEKVQVLLDKIKVNAAGNTMLLPIGGDHLGPVSGLKELINQLELTGYALEQKPINEYFDSINSEGLEEYRGELRDNSRNPILPGVLSTRIYLKQMNSKSTWKLSRIAEPLQAFLQSGGITKNRKNELDFAWKLLLKNHPHDSICGCSIDEVHEENVSRFRQVDQISEAVIDRCINDINKKFSKNDLFAVNLSNYSFSGVVKFMTDRELPQDTPHQLVRTFNSFPKEILLNTQRVPFCEDMKVFYEYLVYLEDIPAFCAKPLTLGNPEYSVTTKDNSLNNSLVEICVNPDGTIDFTDFQAGKKFNNLLTFVDRKDAGDTYNYSPAAKPVKAEFIRVETELGEFRSMLKVHYLLKNTPLLLEITLNAGSKRIEFSVIYENIDKNHMVQARFNLPEKITQTFAENTFGIIARDHDSDYRIENYMSAAVGQELRTNSAPMQRFVHAQGLGVLTEGLHEYVVSKNSLYITLLRSVGMLSKTALDTRNFPAGPPLETPGAQCAGKNSSSFAVCVAENPQELFRQADEFMGSIFVKEGMGKKTELPESFIEINNENVLVYAVKPPDNRNLNGIIFRCLNISEQPQQIIFKKPCTEVNSLEEKISENLHEITFRPGELKTLLL